MRFRKNGPINVMPQASLSGWTVAVSPATQDRVHSGHRTYYDFASREHKEHPALPVPGVLAVRLLLDGKPQMTYDTVKIKDPEFDEKITTLKAAAEEKAATLNAVEAR